MEFLFRKVLKEARNYCYNQLESYILLGLGNLKKNLKKKNQKVFSSVKKGQIEKDQEDKPATEEAYTV